MRRRLWCDNAALPDQSEYRNIDRTYGSSSGDFWRIYAGLAPEGWWKYYYKDSITKRRELKNIIDEVGKL